MSYPRIDVVKINNSKILGTDVRITIILNIATASTATITIEDPVKTDKITDTAMTKDADNVYSYVYSSSEDDNDGTYIATIKISDGTDTIHHEYSFDLFDPFDNTD